MRKIVYYVATSIDGFISGPNGDISGFVTEGKEVDQYLKGLRDYDTVIMGRKTYEFGYKYGLKPGEPAYPNMQHYIFSEFLSFGNQSEKITICKPKLSKIVALKEHMGTDIYLCGGGQFAGWLIDNQLVDSLKVKLNPLILGDGVRLFGNSKKQYKLKLADSQNFDDGLRIITYNIQS